MRIYLAIDIGTYAVKAAILHLDTQKYGVIKVFTRKLSYSDEAELKIQQKTSLELILQDIGPVKFDMIYASLGSQFTVLKQFELQHVKIKDRYKIIASELDILGVFNLADYMLECYPMRESGKYAQILAILIEKRAAYQLIEVFDHCQLNVPIIDLDQMVFLNIVDFLGPEEAYNQAIIILEMGHSKTNLVVIANKKILFVRVLAIAGLQLTKMLKAKLALSFAQAEEIKHNYASLITADNYAIIKDIVNEFIGNLCMEIKLSIQSAPLINELQINKIMLTGGTSNLQDIASTIAQKLEIPTIKLTLQNMPFLAQEEVDFSNFSQLIAILCRSLNNFTNSKINIRYGELSLVKNYDELIIKIKKYAKLAGIFIGFLLCTFLFRYYLYNREINKIKDQYQKEIIRLLGAEPQSLKYISQQSNWNLTDYSDKALQFMQKDLRKKEQVLQSLSTDKIPIPLELIYQISRVIPKSIYFEVVDFKYQEQNLYLEADTDNRNNIPIILERLQQIPMLKDISKISEAIKPGSDGKLIHFGVRANVKH